MESDRLDTMTCHAYNNAAIIAGIHGGIQGILKIKNKKAYINGCMDHKLNLCGQDFFLKMRQL